MARRVLLRYSAGMNRQCRFLLVLVLLFGVLAPLPARAEKPLRVGIRPSSPPFSFLALRENQKAVRGFAVDQCVMIAKVLGRRVDFVPVDDLEERLRMLASGQIDLIAYDSEIHAGPWAAFIPVGINLRHRLYVHRRCSSVTCMRDLHDKRIVVISAAPYSVVPPLDGEIIRVTSPLEALSMLDRGAVDVFLAPSERVADFLIDSNSFQNVLKKGVPLGETPLGILVDARSVDLGADIRSTLEFLGRGGHLERLNEKWFGKTVGGLDLRRYYKHIAAVGASVAALFVGFVLWNVSLKRRVERVARDLRRTEQRYRDLIESSPDMIFLVEESGRILHANERARSALLLPPASEKADFGQLVVKDSPDVAAFLDKVFHDGCDKYEFALKTRDGVSMEVEVAGRVIQGASGTDLQACLFARNVTDRNRMEAELIQSERLGVIGKMAASLAHEINNPLGIIQANAEDLLYAADAGQESREGLTAILRNAVRAGEITTGLLDMASPKPLSRNLLHLEDLVRESAALLGPKLKRLSLDLRFPEEPLAVLGDAPSLHQVLVNLMLNAQESMPDGGTLTITGRVQGEGSARTARLVVQDTGRGIPRRDLPNIFEPFFTSRKTGFGLGLFISRRIVERHGGIVFAESEPGRGTRVIIELPALGREEA
ncbi:ATP-binding protein [Desulfocurvus sp. DL9XJH121]